MMKMKSAKLKSSLASACCLASLLAIGPLHAQTKKSSGPGKLAFMEGSGHAIALAFSLRGFRQAMDALDQPGK